MLATAVEIVAGKLVDILGNRAAQLVDKDKTRAASYEAFYALRRIEETFAKIAKTLENPPVSWRADASAEELRRINDREIAATIALLAPEYNSLAGSLARLQEAFGQMEGKLEIYDSLQSVQTVRLFMDVDDDVLRALFNYGEMPDNVRTIAAGMAAASRDARSKIASFIRENYGVNEREDGR